MPFFLALGILATIMISFCVKKTLSLPKDNSISKNQETKSHQAAKPIPSITNSDEKVPINHHNEIKKSLMPYFSSAATAKKDPGGLGFLDEVGESVDGLTSCTESLGFESSNEKGVGEDLEDISKRGADFPVKISRRSAAVGSEVKKYPPPLSSLNCNGKPNFFLRPMRTEGRLELAEVKIERPEILRSYREDGRLILNLTQELEEDEEEEEMVEDFMEEKEDEKWLFPPAIGGWERFRRCHEVVTRHYHPHIHRVGSLVW